MFCQQTQDVLITVLVRSVRDGLYYIGMDVVSRFLQKIALVAYDCVQLNAELWVLQYI